VSSEPTGGRRDSRTEAYFDTWTPEYDAARFASAAEWINRLRGEGGSLVDVGCGSGNVLAYLREATGLRRLEDLLEMARHDPRAEVVELRSAPAYLSSLQRAAFIRRREDTTLVLRRRDAA
jgi:SAM-dependent methyltransferase